MIQEMEEEDIVIQETEEGDMAEVTEEDTEAVEAAAKKRCKEFS